MMPDEISNSSTIYLPKSDLQVPVTYLQEPVEIPLSETNSNPTSAGKKECPPNIYPKISIESLRRRRRSYANLEHNRCNDSAQDQKSNKLYRELQDTTTDLQFPVTDLQVVVNQEIYLSGSDLNPTASGEEQCPSSINLIPIRIKDTVCLLFLLRCTLLLV